MKEKVLDLFVNRVSFATQEQIIALAATRSVSALQVARKLRRWRQRKLLVAHEQNLASEPVNQVVASRKVNCTNAIALRVAEHSKFRRNKQAEPRRVFRCGPKLAGLTGKEWIRPTTVEQTEAYVRLASVLQAKELDGMNREQWKIAPKLLSDNGGCAAISELGEQPSCLVFTPVWLGERQALRFVNAIEEYGIQYEIWM